MKTIRITIKHEDLKLRNLLHFETQLRDRVQITINKKAMFNRAKAAAETRKLVAQCC